MAWAAPTRLLALSCLLVLTLSETGCIALLGKEARATGAARMMGTTWMTMTVDGASVPVDVESTLTFPSETRITGNGGCNPFSASLSMAANELYVGPIARGRRVCSPHVMATESSFLEALQAVRSFRGTDLFLYLSDESGTERVSLSRVPPGDDTPTGDTPAGDTQPGDTPAGDTQPGDTPAGDTQPR